MMNKPFSQACENNKQPILSVLQRIFSHSDTVLEVGSGTGQHAVYFAEQLPHLKWQPSDREENIVGIESWLEDSQANNIKPPLLIDVTMNKWPIDSVSAVFSANTVHIMSWQEVELFFSALGAIVSQGGIFALYGPFKYQGNYTSASNADFDQWLQQRDPLSGIRDIEALADLAGKQGFELSEDNEMPSNNRLLVWKKIK